MFEIFYENDGADSQICNFMEELESMTKGHTKIINGWAVTRWNDDQWEAGTWGNVFKLLCKESMAEALASSSNAI